MASNIKGITVEIGGNTTGLDKALKDVNKTINSTNSELKQVEKGLKLDPNNVVLANQKQELLSKAISETSDKLKSLKNVQSQVEEQYKKGEIDGGQFRAFQREIENTEIKLSELKNSKKDVSEIGTEANSVRDKLQAVTSQVSKLSGGLKTAGTAAAKLGSAGLKFDVAAVKGAEKALKAYTTAMAGVATAAGRMAISAAESADDINTLSTQTGLSTEEIQKFSYASDIIDVDLETMTGSMAKLTKNMSGAKDGTGTAADAFAQLGVSVTDSNGELRNNQDVFNDAITALGGVANETERDALAMSIFGKSAQDLNPLIEGGADKLAELGESAENAGMIMSQDALDSVNGFNDSIDILKANASGSSKIIGGAFAGSFQKFTDQVGQALPGLAQDVAGLFAGGNIDQASAQFGNHLTELITGLVNQIATQLPTYVQGFNALITQVANAIISALPTIINNILPTLIEGLTGLTTELVAMLPTLIPLLAEGAMQLFTGLLNGLNQVVEQLMPMLPEIIQNITDTLIENLPTIINGGFQLLIGLITGLTNCVPDLINAVIELIPVITQALMDNLPALVTAGIDLIVALAEGLPKAIPALIEAIPEIIKAIIDAFMEQDWLKVGGDILQGLLDGLVAGISSIGDVIADVGSAIYDGFCEFFGIHSPSRLFRDKIGLNLAKGIGVGFDDEMADVNEQMQNALPTSFDTDVDINSLKNLKNSGVNQSATGGNGEPIAFVLTDQAGQIIANTSAKSLDVINGGTVKFSERGLAT